MAFPESAPVGAGGTEFVAAFIYASGAQLSAPVGGASGSSMGNVRSAVASLAHIGPRLRCDCAVTSALRGGILKHPGIPTVLKTQLLRPNWTGPNWRSAGSTPVSGTIFFLTYGPRVTTSEQPRRRSRKIPTKN